MQLLMSALQSELTLNFAHQMPNETYLCRCRSLQQAYWVGVATALILGTRLLLILLARWRHDRHLPPLLQFPRLDLFLALLLVSPIAQAAGSATLACSTPFLWERLHSSCRAATPAYAAF